MILVVTSGDDPMARVLATHQRWQPVMRLTPMDLSACGWRYYAGRGRDAMIPLGGQPRSARDIAGVVVRLERVTARDLPHIAPEDREYVAAEMSAFLLAWLSELDCPMLNRPTPGSFSGPGWRPEQWVHAAARLGIPVVPSGRRVSPRPASEQAIRLDCTAARVTLVGKRHLGTVDESLVRSARRLAALAGTDLLAVTFTGPEPGARFIGASPWPEITDELADAVMDYFDSPLNAHQRSAEALS